MILILDPKDRYRKTHAIRDRRADIAVLVALRYLTERPLCAHPQSRSPDLCPSCFAFSDPID